MMIEKNKLGIITVLREPAFYRELFADTSWDGPVNQEGGWPPEVQAMLELLYMNSGIGSSPEQRLLFWVSYSTDSLNPKPNPHALHLWETEFLGSIFRDRFPTC